MKGRIVLFFSLVWLLLATGVPAGAQAQDTQWNALNAQVRELYRQGHCERALLLAEQALEFAEKNDGPDHFFVSTSLNHLAALHSILGARALAIREKVYGPDHPLAAISLDHLATLYEIQEQHEKAELLYQRALGILEKSARPNLPLLASVLTNLAALYRLTGRDAQAQDLEERAGSLGSTGR